MREAAGRPLAAIVPWPGRAARIDEAVRGALLDSLKTVLDELPDAFSIAPTLISELSHRFDAARYSPALAVVYSELVGAIFDEDEAAVQALLEALHHPAPKSAVVTLSDDGLGAGLAAPYAKQIHDDRGYGVQARALDADALAKSAGRIEQAKAQLRAMAPDFADEVDVLARQIVLVRMASRHGLVFHGAANFYAWGAIYLNADAHADALSLMEGLVHETGHALLFGLSFGKPLALNEASEEFTSPLRDDPRPMDGLVHAAYVLARMAYAHSLFSASDRLDPAQRAEARRRQARCVADFKEGYDTIQRHGRLTPLGQTAMAEAYFTVGELS